jgi:hypothetical protein
MRIKGIKGMTVVDLQDDIANGGKFVVYTYCLSLLVISFKRSTNIYFIKSTENAFRKGLPYSLISLLFGWWGIPWGIMYTCTSLFTNIKGGKDVTTKALHFLQQPTRGHVFEFEPVATLAY